MNVASLKKTLPVLIKNRIVPLLWGYQGVGKTQITGQIVAEMGYGFVKLNLASQEVGDLIGLMQRDEKTEVSYHTRPRWFPTEGKGVVFLDEINRAHPDVIQAMYPFVLEGVMHEHRLPPGWRVVAAANYQSDEFTVTDTSDSAWMSRFCHIHFEPSVEEFVAYAESRGHETVASFIAAEPEMLEVRKKQRPEVPVSPDRRSYMDMLAPLERENLDDGDRYEIYRGLIGETAATRFMQFKKQSTERLRLKDIVDDYGKVRAVVRTLARKVVAEAMETRLDLLQRPIEELVATLENNPSYLDAVKIANFKLYMLDLPTELVVQVVKKLSAMRFDGKSTLLNDPEFANMLFKKSDKQTAAAS
jgi:MoxR-like ATPase